MGFYVYADRPQGQETNKLCDAQIIRSTDGERLEAVVSNSLAMHDSMRVALPNETPSALA